MSLKRRIFAISDIHVDHKENLEFVRSWPEGFYEDDVLLLAGDVTDNLPLLEQTLTILKRKFYKVFFVPGNHELWVRSRDVQKNSVEKFKRILSLCESIEVSTSVEKVGVSTDDYVWIVPLMSWYSTPDDDLQDSLYYEGVNTMNEDVKRSRSLWMDNHMCKWPHMDGETKSKYFASFNEDATNQVYDAPVISFSHFVPRLDLVGATKEDDNNVRHERERLGIGLQPLPKMQGSLAGFNFTRYAGCRILETQIRKLGSTIHVFGHQHRNRDRSVDGVRYVSHCLGMRREREQGYMWGLSEWDGPKQVWPKID